MGGPKNGGGGGGTQNTVGGEKKFCGAGITKWEDPFLHKKSGLLFT